MTDCLVRIFLVHVHVHVRVRSFPISNMRLTRWHFLGCVYPCFFYSRHTKKYLVVQYSMLACLLCDDKHIQGI